MTFSKQGLARRLKLQQLAILEQVLASGSISAASRQLHMTQPAISKAIQDLEEHFGQPVLARSVRGVHPTDFGTMLLRHSETLMAELRHLAEDLNAWEAGVSGKVMVGTLLTASVQLLPRAIGRLREMAPNVVVQVQVGVNEKMFPQLLRGDLDVVVGLIPGQDSDGEYDHVSLYDDSLCAVVGRQHPLAASNCVAVDVLKRQDWILPVADSEAMHAAERFFAAIGMEKPAHRVESVSIMTNLGLLLDSPMIALMAFSVARKFVKLGLLTVLPLARQAPDMAVGYTLARGRVVTPACQRLLRALHEVARQG